MSIDNHKSDAGKSHPSSDYTLYLPDECLAFILQSLDKYDDRSNSSLVCRRWLRIEGQTRRRLTLKAQFDIVPSIFARFDSITELALIRRGEPAAILGRSALTLISLECKKLTRLTRLTLRNCKISTCGVEALSKTCARLEELHLERVEIGKAIGSGADPDASSSLKVICLEDMDKFNVCCFVPLIKASKSLRTFKLVSLCSPPLDTLFRSIADSVTEIHLEHVVVNDVELGVISSCCPNLEILCLVKFLGNCSDAGIAMVANKCRSLRKLRIDDFWHRGKYNDQIRDKGLMAVAKNCPNLEELVLDGVMLTQFSLAMLGSKCLKLERLTLCGCTTVRGAELMCIAANCSALKKLWIEYCPVYDRDIQGLASGCPNLAQVMFRECTALTLEGVCQLRASRASLVVDFDKDGRGRCKAPAKQRLCLRQ